MAIDNSSLWQAPAGRSFLGLELTESDADADTFVMNTLDGTGNLIGVGGGGASPLSEANRTFTCSGTAGGISDGFRHIDGVGYGFAEAWWEWAFKNNDQAVPWGIGFHIKDWKTSGTIFQGLFNWVNGAPIGSQNSIYISTMNTPNLLRMITVQGNNNKGWNNGVGEAGRVSVSSLDSEECWVAQWCDGTNMYWGLKKGSSAPSNLSDCDYSIRGADNLNTIPDWDYADYGTPPSGYGIGVINNDATDTDFKLKMFITTVGKYLLDPS